LQERLDGTERHLMDKLAAEKSARLLEQRAANKRAKDLEAQLKSAQRQAGEQTSAAIDLQQALRQELEALRRRIDGPAPGCESPKARLAGLRKRTARRRP